MNEAVVPSGASLLRSPRPSPAMRVRAKRPAPPIGMAGAGAFTVPYRSQPDPRPRRSAFHPWRRIQSRPRRAGQSPCVRSARASACVNEPSVQGRSPAAMRVGHPRALSAAGRLFVNGPDAQGGGDESPISGHCLPVASAGTGAWQAPRHAVQARFSAVSARKSPLFAFRGCLKTPRARLVAADLRGAASSVGAIAIHYCSLQAPKAPCEREARDPRPA